MKATRLYALVMITLIVGAIILGTSFAQIPSPAVNAGQTKIAVCDIMKLFRNNTRTLDALADMKKHAAVVEAEAKRIGLEIDAKTATLGIQKEGSPAYEAAYQARQKLVVEREIYVKIQSDQALRKHAAMTKLMYLEITSMIKRVAKENGFDIVLSAETTQLRAGSSQELNAEITSRKVLYANDKCDITDTVLTRLKQAYKAGL